MDKVQCPKCKTKKGIWKWVVWRDVFGRTIKCPNCKSLFIPKNKKYPFMNKKIWGVVFGALLGGVVGTIVPISIILLLEAIFDNKLLILVILISVDTEDFICR